MPAAPVAAAAAVRVILAGTIELLHAHLAEATYWVLTKRESYHEPRAPQGR